MTDDTPRTNEQVLGWITKDGSDFVHASFARDLERENAKLKRYCECLEDQLDEHGLKTAQRNADDCDAH